MDFLFFNFKNYPDKSRMKRKKQAQWNIKKLQRGVETAQILFFGKFKQAVSVKC